MYRTVLSALKSSKMNKQEVLSLLNKLLESDESKLTNSQRQEIVKKTIKKVEEGRLTTEQLLKYIIEIGVLLTEVTEKLPLDP